MAWLSASVLPAIASGDFAAIASVSFIAWASVAAASGSTTLVGGHADVDLLHGEEPPDGRRAGHHRAPHLADVKPLAPVGAA